MLKAAVARIKLGGRDDYEVYKCEKCGPREVQDGWKQDALTKLGAMLALHVKRFEVVDPVRLDDGTLIGETRKRDDRVAFGPLLLIPTTDVDGAVSSVPSELRAVVAHVGDTMDAGHCIAFVKGADNRWYMHDDRYVRLATDDEVFGVEAQRQAYLLLYKVRLDIDIDIYIHTHTHT
jgi:ubiquitin C-terminal hydrolase